MLLTLSTLGGDFDNAITTDVTYIESLDQNQMLCISISVTEDNILENEEEFTVSLSSTDSNVTTGSPSTVIIIDNDG